MVRARLKWRACPREIAPTSKLGRSTNFGTFGITSLWLNECMPVLQQGNKRLDGASATNASSRIRALHASSFAGAAWALWQAGAQAGARNVAAGHLPRNMLPSTETTPGAGLH